jgi:large subunit ribosomal protein L25
MANPSLKVEERVILGKKVARLRRQGVTPANIYGHGLDSKAVQVSTPELVRLLKETSRNAIIDLSVGGEPSSRPVMIRSVQRDPVTHEILHVDFYQVSLREKMRAEVPVHLVGESPAVKDLGGILLQEVETLTVRALPTDIPAAIEIDVSGLTELEQSLHVGQLPRSERYEILADPEVVVVKVAAPRLAAEAEEAPVEEEVETAIEEAAEAEEEEEE